MTDDNDIIDSSELELDEGMPNLSKKKIGNNLNIKIILIAAAFLVVILIVLFNQDNTPPPEPLDGTEETKQFSITNTLGEAPKIPENKKREEINRLIKSNRDADKLRHFTDNLPDIKNLTGISQSRKNKKGVMYFNRGESATATIQKSSASESTETSSDDKNAAKTLQASLQTTEISSVKANMLVDRDMFITKGAFLDCALETAINSTLSGMISCRLTSNVYSTSGRVLLLERGSRITGEYQGGLKNGQARIFAVWSRIETPNGVLIDITSPGTDPLGRTGHSGHVETFFWKKFGSAILLSFIDDVSTAVTSRLSKSVSESSASGTVTVEGPSGNNAIPTKALESSINIPPVLTKHQGDHISIFVARDLDFRSVYELKTHQ